MSDFCVSPLRLCGYGLVLSGRICLFNRWILFPFSAFLWFDFFCSVVHAASLYLASVRFYRYCILTVSLPSLFHFVSSLSLLSSSLFLYLTCTNAVISPHLSLISWLTRDTTPYADTPILARNLQIQQVLQPVDPQTIPGLVRTHLDSEGDKDGQAASASQLSQPSELTQPSSTGNPPRGADRLGLAVCLPNPEL